MIKTVLTEEEKSELLKIRRSASDYRSERALCVIMNSDGGSPVQIAKSLKRSYFTVRNWLLNFSKKRIDGLYRTYSPGRPADSRIELKSYLETWLKETPEKYGFIQNCWNKRLIISLYEKTTGKSISEDTAERALKDSGFSYKKPKKSVPLTAPSKEEKLLKINTILSEIKEMLNEEDTEVFAIDESHFSTEPYLIKGWFKKGEHFFPADTKGKAKLHDIWSVESEDRIILLQKRAKRQC